MTSRSALMKTTADCRAAVRQNQKHPGLKAAGILRVLAEPQEERSQADRRFALWGLVLDAQNRAARGPHPPTPSPPICRPARTTKFTFRRRPTLSTLSWPQQRAAAPVAWATG